MRSEKATNTTDGFSDERLMILDVLPRDIGQELLVLVFVRGEDQRTLVAEGSIESPTAEIQAELEGHVEPRIAGSRIRSRARQIMDGVLGLPDQVDKFIETHLGGVQSLSRTQWTKTTGENGEDDRLENGRVLFIEWTIDEDALKVRGRLPGSQPDCASTIASRRPSARPHAAGCALPTVARLDRERDCH